MAMKFRLLAGQHIEAGPFNETLKIFSDRLYKQGEIIETDKDLERQFGAEKFQRVYDHIPGPATATEPVPVSTATEAEKRRR